jgi:Raf kinase inhibitor-like YbhB/YbcL family protein
MSVSSGGITGGVIGGEYGKRGKQKKGGIPTLSLPITIKDAPDKTVCRAISMIDPDSNPVWTHWLAVNLHAEELPENASVDMAKDMAQGKNDFGFIGYGGPTPPNGRHTYVITVYALDAEVNLPNGFSKKQFADAIEGHVLAKAEVKGSYQ